MANLLKGGPVSKAIIEQGIEQVEMLKQHGITPTLAIMRVGEKSSDISYEKGAMKRCEQMGVEVRNIIFTEEISEKEFLARLEELNNDESIDGILVLRPLPKHIDDEKVRNTISPSKDVDGCTDLSLAGVFNNTKIGFCPCTAEAAVAILKYYNIDIAGKKAVVLGRSLVIGRPVAMLLLHENATVTICHSKSDDIKKITSDADILITATGKMESVDKEYVSSKQSIIDVGISFNETKNKLCGDVLFEEVEPVVMNITPVPGGVGAVTTSILVKHVIEAAERKCN